MELSKPQLLSLFDRIASEEKNTAKIIAKDGMSYTVFISVYYYIRLNYGIV